MTVKINVNLSYAFPHNLQSLFSKVFYVTTAHIARQSRRDLKKLPPPALFRFSTGCKRDQKHLPPLGFKILRKVFELHAKTVYPWIRFCINMTSDTPVDSLAVDI